MGADTDTYVSIGDKDEGVNGVLCAVEGADGGTSFDKEVEGGRVGRASFDKEIDGGSVDSTSGVAKEVDDGHTDNDSFGTLYRTD